MKKNNLVFFVGAAIIFSACNFQLPEKISVKTNAEYKLNVGKVKNSFDESIDKNGVINSNSLGIPNSQVYDYFPAEKNLNVQQYLIKLPLMEIPVDIGQYYKNSGISTAVQGMSFEKEIKIPTVAIETKKNIDTKEINNSLNTMFSFTGIAGDGSVTFAGDFDSVTYSSGKMIISAVDGSSIPDGTLVSVSGRNGTFRDNKSEIDIGGLTIRKNAVNVTFSDGHGTGFIGTIKEGSKISEATGVIYNGLDIPVNTNFVIPNNFISAVVNEGVLHTSIDIPWTGTDITYQIATSGALSVSGTGDINLAGKKMYPGTVNVTTTIKVDFKGATLKFAKNPTVSISSDINSFSEVVISASDIETSMDKTENFTPDVYNSVKEIMLIPSGLTGTYTNTLPEGNNIQIVASSDFFGISNGVSTLGCGKTDEKMDPIMSPSGFRKSVVPVDVTQHNPSAGKYSGWDFNMNIKFQSVDDNPNHICVKNVKPAEKYKIAMDFEPELNWEYIRIQPANGNNAEVKSLGINFAKMFSSMSDVMGVDLGSNAQLVSVPLYIRAEKPNIGDSFNDLKFKGKIDLFYAKDDGGVIQTLKKNGNDIKKEILENSSEMKFVDSIPEYKLKNKSLITNIAQYDASKKDNLAGLINDTLEIPEGELYIDYDIALTGAGNSIKITKEQCEGSLSTSISVVALIDIPLKFKVISDSEPIIMNVGSFMGSDSGADLFGRTSPTSVSGFGEYDSVIESCGFKFETKQMPFYSDPEMELNIEIMPGESKKQKAKNGEIMVSSDGIHKMFSEESYPYSPKIQLLIPPLAEFSIPREMKLEMKVILVINTDGTIDLLGGNN